MGEVPLYIARIHNKEDQKGKTAENRFRTLEPPVDMWGCQGCVMALQVYDLSRRAVD